VVGGSALRRSRRGVSEVESCRGGHHGSAAAVDGGDDLLGIDALQVDRGGTEVGVTELALNDVQGHALVGELNRMGVAELVGANRRRTPAWTARR